MLLCSDAAASLALHRFAGVEALLLLLLLLRRSQRRGLLLLLLLLLRNAALLGCREAWQLAGIYWRRLPATLCRLFCTPCRDARAQPLLLTDYALLVCSAAARKGEDHRAGERMG